MANMAPELMRRVHDLVHRFGGSISAEHGIGRLKVGDLERYGDPTKLAAMRAIKKALDPRGIMNPGAVLAPCMRRPSRSSGLSTFGQAAKSLI
jgi:FAD/FMN-containing dehydrogenase